MPQPEPVAAQINDQADRPGGPRRGERFLDLVAVMDTLRSPGGCPWDAQQTHASLVKYLLEEAYETAEAIEVADDVALREELGDVLLQVVFHARIAQEPAPGSPGGSLGGSPGESGGRFDIDDVAGGIVDKLVRRHPHVFAGAAADTAGDVEAKWEKLKATEKGRTSAADGVPMAQPALALASALIGRATKAGLAIDVSAPIAAPPTIDDESIGDLLLAVVALARTAGIDAEGALRAASRRYRGLVRAAEASGR